MTYFINAFEYAKKHPGRTVLILFLDMLYYILFGPIMLLWLGIFRTILNKMPMQALSSMVNNLQLSYLENLLSALIRILLSIFGSVLFLILLFLIHIAVFKSVIWFLTLEKKIALLIIMKTVLLNIVFILIFLIPMILSLIPIFADVNNYMATQQINPNPLSLVVFVILLCLLIYLLTLSYYYLIKYSSFKKAFKNSFKTGFLNFKKLPLSFIFSFLTIAASAKLLANYNLFYTLTGQILFLLIIVVISFMNRIYIVSLEKN